MRTNIVLDENLVEEAIRLSGARTKRDVVHRALKEFVENRKRLDLMELAGKVKFSDKYDHKALRMGK